MNNEELIRRIENLENWKRERERQQIVFPIDLESLSILARYFMNITGTVISEGGAGGNTFFEYIGQQGGESFAVSRDGYLPYSVNTSTNVVTVLPNKIIRDFPDDMQVLVAVGDINGAPPSPLSMGTTYYVINSTGLSFELSASLGGAAINITDTGVGAQYLYYF